MYCSYLGTPDEKIKENDNMIMSLAENDPESEIKSLNCEIVSKNDENDEEIDEDKIYHHINGNDSNNNGVKTAKNKITEGIKKKNESMIQFIAVNNDKDEKNVIFKITKENAKKGGKKYKIFEELPPSYKNKVFRIAESDNISYYLEQPIFKMVSKTKNIVKSRKYDNGNIYKKIRGRIFKLVIKKLKKNLKIEFVYAKISQNSKKIDNKQYLNSTIEEVLRTVEENIKVFEELEKANSLDEESKEILNSKVEDIYKEYFNSEEFQESLKDMKKKHYDDYIYLYIQKCKNYFDYYNNEEEESDEKEINNEI